MRITISDMGGEMHVDCESCPREGEKIVFRGKLFLVTKVVYQIYEDDNLCLNAKTVVYVERITD